MQKKTGKTGFAMLEAVVMVIILSVGLAGAFKCVSLATEASEVARASVGAELLAQMKMSEIEGTPSSFLGTNSGTHSNPPRMYQWRSSLSPTKDPKLFSAHVEVSYSVRSRERSFDLRTLIYSRSEMR